MPIDANSIRKPFRKMRKLLKNFPDPPAAEDVHKLRTHTRRLEAIIGGFRLNDETAGKDTLKSLKPIRKAAGEVRDMDVLTDLAASLDPKDDADCRLKLMQHLACRRTKVATKLVKKVNALEKRLRAELKQCVAESGIMGTKTGSATGKEIRKTRERAASSMASSLQVEQDLRDWPRLDDENIHPFRIKVKELRYVLQFAQDSDSKLTRALGAVKDQIGLWHDWNELAAIAEQVLDHGAECRITSQIVTRTKHELEKSLDTANALRSQYLPSKAGSGSKKSEKKSAVSAIHPEIIQATSRLAS
jgi:CHAD domain-containing protein